MDTFRKKLYVHYYNASSYYESGSKSGDTPIVIFKHEFKGDYEDEKMMCEYKIEFTTYNVNTAKTDVTLSRLIEAYEDGKLVEIDFPIKQDGFEYREDCIKRPKDPFDNILKGYLAAK